MNREDVFEAFGGIDDDYVAESARYAPGDADSAPGRIVHMNKKRWITFLIAAVLMLTLSVTAYAAHAAVATPKAAEKVALEQIEIWKKMGILSEKVHFDGKANDIREMEERDGGDAWFGRLFPHVYRVFFYGYNGDGDTRRKYGCSLSVDTMTGKIIAADIDADADDDEIPVREEKFEEPIDDPTNPDAGTKTTTWYFYDNYDDIFPADMTVDHFCELLAEYWGFSGYTIADTDAEYFYNQHFDAIDGSTLLKDINGDTRENYYLTVFFEGDQEGAPMYIQLHQFPGYVMLTVGTNHAVG